MAIEDLPGQIQYSCIIQRHHAAIWSTLQMHAHGPAVGMVVATEIVPNGLHVQIQFLCDAVDAAIRKIVFDPPQFVEGDIHEIGFWLVTP